MHRRRILKFLDRVNAVSRGTGFVRLDGSGSEIVWLSAIVWYPTACCQYDGARSTGQMLLLAEGSYRELLTLRQKGKFALQIGFR